LNRTLSPGLAVNPLQIQLDFEWLLSSPTLLNPKEVRDRFGVEVLQLDPSRIQVPQSEFVRLANNLRSRRVGDYFEQLSLLAIEQLPECEVLERHLQIQSQGRTIGEIDCIYRNPFAQIVHVEIAVKFFLFNDQLPSLGVSDELSQLGILNHYIGPNPSDSLAGKLQHMLTRQLQLAEHVPHSVDQKQVFMQGILHYRRKDFWDSRLHKSIQPQQQPMHPLIAAKHEQGTWIHLNELEDLHPHRNPASRIEYRVMVKPHWLSNQMPDADWQEYPEFAEAVTTYFESGGTALLALLRLADKSESSHSVERCFIVHDRWPEPA
jgi:hypothetical protein